VKLQAEVTSKRGRLKLTLKYSKGKELWKYLQLKRMEQEAIAMEEQYWMEKDERAASYRERKEGPNSN
jgi:hypothetical protein